MSSRTVSVMMICLSTFSLTLTAAARQYRAAGNYAVGNRPVAIAAGDFNSDGKLDLAVANLGSQSVSILLGKGDGSFEARQDFETGVDPWTLAAVDIDGDGPPTLWLGIGATPS
jgi:FG-GAP-like repeat